MNQLQEQFYQVMTNLRASQSRAASVPKEDARVTEIVDGLIVTRPAKKITHLSNQVQEQQKQESEQVVIDLQEYAKSRSGKAGSVSNQGINKLKAIHDFMFSNGRL